ncbi:2172_t:CDS:2, partial [Racocetra persica]
EEFDTAMKHLNFSMAIDFETQRKLDYDDLKLSLNEMKEVDFEIQRKLDYDDLKFSLNEMKEILKISEVISEVNIMKSQDTSVFKQIDPKYLTPCSMGPDERNSSYLCKRMYKFEEVGCKGFNIKDDQKKKQKLQRHLAILERLSECRYILKFYGLSHIEGKDVQVFQWAELGSLRDVYTANDIGWVTKVSIARDICRGLAFLQSVDILHQDIRGENIMDPKIKEIQQTFEYIMKTTWNDEPYHRMGVGKLYVHLESLAEKYVKPGDLPRIYNNNEIDFDGSKFYDDGGDMDFIKKQMSELNFNICDVEIKEPTPLSEGLKIHQSINKDRELAIRKLKLATSLGNPNAKALLKKE